MQAGAEAEAEAVDLSLKAFRTVARATWNTLFGLPHRLGPPLRCAVPRLSAVLYGLVSKSHFQYTLTAFGRFAFVFALNAVHLLVIWDFAIDLEKPFKCRQTDGQTNSKADWQTDTHSTHIWTHTYRALCPIFV